MCAPQKKKKGTKRKKDLVRGPQTTLETPQAVAASEGTSGDLPRLKGMKKRRDKNSPGVSAATFVPPVPADGTQKKTKKLKRKRVEAQQAAPSTDAAAPSTEAAEAAPPPEKKSRMGARAARSTVTKARKHEKHENAFDPVAAAYRKKHEIVIPASCPAPFETFASAQALLGEKLVNALKAQGYAEPTPIQAQSWPLALRGLDMVGVAQTGSGKTCAFVLPALARYKPRRQSDIASPRTLVLAPTRELVQQITIEAKKFADALDARVVKCYGGVPKGEQVAELEAGADIIAATPGRLIDFCTGDPSRDLAAVATLKGVSYLVLDEADRMLDMGFESDIRKIVRMCLPAGTPEEALADRARQTLLFTATWPMAVRKIASTICSKSAVQVRIGQGRVGDQLAANENVQQTVLVIKEEEKSARLRDILASDLKPGETAIVFAGRKTTCDRLEAELQSAHVVSWCRAMHGDKEQHERERTLGAFRSMTVTPQPGRNAVLIATDVASRGLDIPGVAMIVVYDFGGEADRPGTDSYVHRIGRTGRAGKKGRSFAFFTPEDLGAASFAQLLKGAGQTVPAELEKLAADDAWWQEQRKSKDKWKKGAKGGKQMKGFTRAQSGNMWKKGKQG